MHIIVSSVSLARLQVMISRTTKFKKKKIVFGEKICFNFICSVYLKINSKQEEFSEMFSQIYIGFLGTCLLECPIWLRQFY